MYTLKFIGFGPGTFDEPCLREIAHFKDGIAEVRYVESRDRLVRLGGIKEITEQVQETPDEKAPADSPETTSTEVTDETSGAGREGDISASVSR